MNYKRNNKTLILFSIVIVILLIIYLKISFRNTAINNSNNTKLNDAITLIFKEDNNIQAPEQLTNSILNKLEEIGADLTTIGDNSVSFYPTSDNYTSLWFFININNKDLIVQCEYNNNDWIVKYIENEDTNIFYYVPSNVKYEDVYSIVDDSLIHSAEIKTETTTEVTTIVTTEETTNINPLYNIMLCTRPIMSGIGNNEVGQRKYITIDRDSFNSIPGKYVYEFLTNQLNDCNYINIFFTDGTGIYSNTGYLLIYGELDSDGGVSYIDKQYTYLAYNSDKQIYE